MLKLSDLENFLIKILKIDTDKILNYEPKTVELKSRQVFDSRGFPTVETDVI